METTICSLKDIIRPTVKQTERCMKMNDCLNNKNCPYDDHYKRKFITDPKFWSNQVTF